MSSLSSRQWQEIRRELDDKRGSDYWRSVEELVEDPAFTDFLEGELPSHRGLWSAPIERRRVLKLMAASLALGGLTACDGQPQEYLVPYVNMPEGLVPGMPRYYATSHLVDGYAQGLLAQSREGRPLKLEGNPEHPATLGACDSFSQASILSLYDPDRQSAVTHKNETSSYGAFLGDIIRQRQRWDDSRGEGLAFLTGPWTSPSETRRIEALKQRWPKARWYRHSPVERGNVYAASRQLFGTPREPIYRFDRARVVLSLDADFLQAQPGFLRYAHDFAERRRPRDTDELLRLYVIESTPSITGAMAEHRQSIDRARMADAARQLARALGIEVEGPKISPLPPEWLDALVGDLRRQGSAALVIPGDQQSPEVHAIAQAINAALGAIGSTVEFIAPVDASHEHDALEALVDAMQAGEVSSLVMLNVNPAYSAPGALDFAGACEQVPWRIHWGDTHDETARLCHWHVPATHPLETWGDARAFDGTLSLLQPLIEPLHGGKTALQFLAALEAGTDRPARELLLESWQGRYARADFDSFWAHSLRRGFVADSAFEPREASLQNGWQDELPRSALAPEGLLLQLRPDPSLWDGSVANNAWLQELPRPLTKVTWATPLLIAPALAEREALENGDTVTLRVGEQVLEAPIYILPGMPKDAVTLPLGGGRTRAGRVADGVGTNAYRLQPRDGAWEMAVTLEKSGGHHPLAVTQNHHAIEGRDLIRTASLEVYRDNPRFAQHEGPSESLYPEPWPAPRDAQHAWGMSIDLSACIGCNACVTACQAENNIPVVGEQEVRMGREMHWIRIDRYFKGPLEGPEMVFQPVTCMHCENAPCEYVCPVGATQHSAEGLNEMIYNRCVGTRYCSQNCPYKVRRFNWFDYTREDSGHATPKPAYNPEVTVRSRGVMEKCTYCVQRINRERLTAEIEDRDLADGDVQTACQQSCPTQAIVFGDLKDPDSQVSKLHAHPLDYGMLAHLNVRPRTHYLAAVRDPNPALAGKRPPSGRAEVGIHSPQDEASEQESPVFFRQQPPGRSA
ncbi:prokaryotic molybdopterin-containing oxidoreductase family, iron-sulfur binding subunit [Modicisalibacter ilicicola DSM 19980]|uniref:Prokaryotic molybdopterin-containing oxidoreductase family, iron-sulfur binding subunit n=1 Tax=Modicisalibacter ilicicola DSM 19980 TaxID=1121942 RepID=A0A1M5CID6_9GAMM|nr:TAT-variant-translocated molybdopterin oxidoreductase [Halomonas ilicicola]SHF54431.1 prokaryotic molybdopterin-containing oxidoreductase family, iron-sulfur binding subunit [Halomonas ilicicola DSM 19980]